MDLSAADGVFARFQLESPDTSYFVRLGGYIHKSPWYLPRAVIPAGADRDAALRVPAEQWTPWIDIRQFAEGRLHGRMQRSGGVAELPNVTADFVVEPPAERLTVAIELATEPRDDRVVKRWRESLVGTLTSFLVSPDLARDADSLETAAEMTARRLAWAHEATGGQRHSPRRLIVQTSFWAPQRPELNLREAEMLHLLGFNVVGNQRPEVRERFPFVAPGHTHDVQLGPASTREEIDVLMTTHAERFSQSPPSTAAWPDLPVPFGFADEVCCRPPIGDNGQALGHFHAWLERQGISPRDLGVERLSDVVPLESPEALRERESIDGPAARRVFYYTSRFRQQAATDRVAWHTEAFHRHFTGDFPAVTSTLVADHPYFAGSGMGMGMTPNPTWGGYPLTMDWFELARRGAIDLAGIEDWMGLQYMYGPNTTWEGFQLMGFQASIFRSGSRGRLPIIAWITPSDEVNLRLKTASALCQGAKHFFYWTYGPTATSTENYWSDLRGAYDGIAAMTRQLAAAEHRIAPGRTRPTRVALLYSISSDLWQPFGYVPMLERRGTYLSLIHDQYLVDMLTEEDVTTGRLDDYDVLYTADPCIRRDAAQRIVDWVARGGHLVATAAAGSRDEFNEPSDELAATFGIGRHVETLVQPGRYHIRGALNGMAYLDQIQPVDGPVPPTAADANSRQESDAPAPRPWALGTLGVRVAFAPTTSRVLATFRDGSPAVVENRAGKGRAVYVGACPALAYIKEANFVPDALQEKWPEDLRAQINAAVRQRGVERLAELSHAVVETGVYETESGTALVLANFTYQPIDELQVCLPVSHPLNSVRSVERGELRFQMETSDTVPGSERRGGRVRFTMSLGLTDIVLME
ncbi:MAG: hypothetical protein KJ000_04920 [Pirellulaceae bacterium]|nr:hypothetical protein [Pirellulaceae bacterium]